VGVSEWGIARSPVEFGGSSERVSELSLGNLRIGIVLLAYCSESCCRFLSAG
jgi:hypothetical protein